MRALTGIGLISYVVLWVLVLTEGALIIALARLVGRLTKRIPAAGARVINPGPPIGSFVDSWETVDLLGRPVAYTFPRKHDVLLVYLSPHCTVCSKLIPSAKRFFREVADMAEGAWIMVLGDQASQIDYAQRNGLTSHPVLSEESLPASWRVEGAPFALWISSAGEVKTKGMVNSREHLESIRNAVMSGYPSMESQMAALSEQQEQQRDLSQSA